MASQWISVTDTLGYPQPGIVYDTNKGLPIGATAKFRDIGTTYLGEGDFIWLPGAASTVLGDWCTYTTSDGTANTGSTTRWAGTANLPYPLAVATCASIASTWAWYQRAGSAICNTNGTIAAGNGAAWQATATVQAAAVATKNVEGAIAQSANGVPATNQAIYLLSYPSSQTAV
ncbi:hypothetical protein UFOVP833_61 [uncultured Caudovirales phage]|uniref:Uncharacterized protein n=1 Tax=uncultured Caudovirales phage TaxID=2100421 RepID=A0A6J5PCZ8_9CAUD|nr:hypothetical protein UFOVP833_61 [uncultured Caudovirales phage]CAB4218345.1 hypothetical protein UFOVP1603_27 [uncultured Caudovirales phage]